VADGPDITRVTSDVASLSTAVGGVISQLGLLEAQMSAIAGSFTKFSTTTENAFKTIGKMSKGLTGVGTESKKTKKVLEQTWVDIIDDDIVKALDKQLKAIDRLTVGTKEFSENLETISKQGSEFEIIDSADLNQQLNALQAIDKKLNQVAGNINKMASSKIGLSIQDSGAAVKEINSIMGQMEALKLQAGVARRSLESSFDIDTDPFVKKLKELNPAFSAEFTKIRDSAATNAAELRKLYATSMVPELSAEDVHKLSGGSNIDPKHYQQALQAQVAAGGADDVSAQLQKAGKSLTTVFDPSATEEQKKQIQACLELMELENTSLEQAIASQMLLNSATSKLPEIHERSVKAMTQEKKLASDIAKAKIEQAGKGGIGAILGGFSEGGFRGGMSAMAHSVENKRRAILSSGLSTDEKSAEMRKAGYKVTTNDRGETSYKANFMTSMKQGISQLANRGAGSLIKGEGAEAFSGLIRGAQGAEAGLGAVGGAAEGAGLAAEGAGAGMSGAGAAVGTFGAVLGVAAGAVVGIIAIFKIFAAVMDHAAKNYREVKQVGGVSGMLGRRDLGGAINLKEDAAAFRKNLVKGGGSALQPSLSQDGFYMLVEKKLEVLGAAQQAGLSGATFQEDVNRKNKKGDFGSIDAEEYSVTAKYLQTAAEAAELLGKDLKEAANEVATLHEELSLSFGGVEMFLMNITRSATQAGVSNEKFMKITRSLANEQTNYGTELKNTSRILSTLGESGRYTSETLKKSFETLIPDKQSIEQKVVANSMAMQNSGVKASVIGSIKSAITDLDTREAELQAIIDANPTSSAAQDAKKEQQSMVVKRSGLKENLSAWSSGNAYAAAGAQDYLPTTAKLTAAIGAMGAQMPMLREGMKRGLGLDQLLEAARSLDPTTRNMLATVYGIKDPVEALAQLKPLLEGAAAKIKNAFFDADGKKRSTLGSDEESINRFTEILTSAGMSEKEAREKVASLASGNDDGTGTSGNAVRKAIEGLFKNSQGELALSNRNIALAEKSGAKAEEETRVRQTEAEKLRATLAQSNVASTDTADKIKQWMEPLLETGNEWLATMTAGFSAAFDKFGNGVRDREKAAAAKRQDAIISGAESSISDAQDAINKIDFAANARDEQDPAKKQLASELGESKKQSEIEVERTRRVHGLGSDQHREAVANLENVSKASAEATKAWRDSRYTSEEKAELDKLKKTIASKKALIDRTQSGEGAAKQYGAFAIRATDDEAKVLTKNLDSSRAMSKDSKLFESKLFTKDLGAEMELTPEELKDASGERKIKSLNFEALGKLKPDQLAAAIGVGDKGLGESGRSALLSAAQSAEGKFSGKEMEMWRNILSVLESMNGKPTGNSNVINVGTPGVEASRSGGSKAFTVPSGTPRVDNSGDNYT